MKNITLTMTDEQALLVFHLVGNARIIANSTDLYQRLGRQLYQNGNFIREAVHFQIIDGMNNENVIEFNRENFDKALKRLRDENEPIQQEKPRRDANGHFLPKKWVARFDYHSEKDHVWTNRHVITNYKGRRRPILTDSAYLKGYDVNRRGLRTFICANISNITWSKEYTQE